MSPTQPILLISRETVTKYSLRKLTISFRDGDKFVRYLRTRTVPMAIALSLEIKALLDAPNFARAARALIGVWLWRTGEVEFG